MKKVFGQISIERDPLFKINQTGSSDEIEYEKSKNGRKLICSPIFD